MTTITTSKRSRSSQSRGWRAISWDNFSNWMLRQPRNYQNWINDYLQIMIDHLSLILLLLVSRWLMLHRMIKTRTKISSWNLELVTLIAKKRPRKVGNSYWGRLRSQKRKMNKCSSHNPITDRLSTLSTLVIKRWTKVTINLWLIIWLNCVIRALRIIFKLDIRESLLYFCPYQGK